MRVLGAQLLRLQQSQKSSAVTTALSAAPGKGERYILERVARWHDSLQSGTTAGLG